MKATPWDAETFFEFADRKASPAAALGLRWLLGAACAVGSRIDLMWGAGEKQPRFAIRTKRQNAGELISGWADGTIGIQVGNLSVLLGSDSTEVEHLLITAGYDKKRSHREPLLDAALLTNPLVQARMKALIERIAGLDGDRDTSAIR